MKMQFRGMLFVGGLAIAVSGTAGRTPAQHITIDGQLSPAQTLKGPNYQIGANLGRQIGGNLFESFGRFDLSAEETATFSGPSSVTNVIGRVTDGSASSIDGTIKSTIPNANIYLINPAGIVFEPKAELDVSGSFHASSADYLKLSDGSRFQATNSNVSTLTAAPPQAFGFLSASPAAIAVNRSSLEVSPGRTLDLSGGNLSITRATLSAPAGSIGVTSVAGTGEIPVAPNNGAGATVLRHGSASITGGSVLNVSDPADLASSGGVYVRAGSVVVDGSKINADNYGSGGGIVLSGDTQVTIRKGAYVHALALASGAGPGISILTGPAGTIEINGRSSKVASHSNGNGGEIMISGGSVAIQNGATVLDAGGSITVSAQELAIRDDADINVSTTGSGSAGDVILNVSGSLKIIDGSGIQADSEISGNRNAGNVMINAGSILLQDVGVISTTSLGQGDAGNIRIISPGSLAVGNGSFISAIALGSGHGGSVNVVVADAEIQAGGFISSSTDSTGQAGSVVVGVTGTLAINGGSFAPGGTGIFSESDSVGCGGNGGAVTVSAGNLSISSNGSISSHTFGTGNGGDITVTVRGDIVLSGIGPQVTAQSEGAGNAGKIVVSTDNLISSNGASISTEAASANGGDILLSVANLTYLNQSSIATSVDGAKGNGGNIVINSGRYVILGSSKVEADAFGGNGGNITITTKQFIASPDSIVQASSAMGISGDITIRAPADTVTAALASLSARLGAPAIRLDCSAAAERTGASSVIPGSRRILFEGGSDPEMMRYFAGRSTSIATPVARSADEGALPVGGFLLSVGTATDWPAQINCQ